MSATIPIDYKRIAAFCGQWKIVELFLFGSVLRDDFQPDSDVDVLATLLLLVPLGQLLPYLGGIGIFDLLIDLERGLGVGNGLSAVTEFIQCQTHIEERIAFTAAVANLTFDD